MTATNHPPATDLLPCPFCGERLAPHDGFFGRVWTHPVIPNDCAISTATITDAEAWNARASPSLTDETVDRAARAYEDSLLGSWKQPNNRERRMDAMRAALASLHSQPEAEGAVETGWLIEGEMPDGSPGWMTLKPAEALWGVVLTKDSNEALRFARRDDAEAYFACHLDDAPYRITEHRWG